MSFQSIKNNVITNLMIGLGAPTETGKNTQTNFWEKFILKVSPFRKIRCKADFSPDRQKSEYTYEYNISVLRFGNLESVKIRRECARHEGFLSGISKNYEDKIDTKQEKELIRRKLLSRGIGDFNNLGKFDQKILIQEYIAGFNDAEKGNYTAVTKL